MFLTGKHCEGLYLLPVDVLSDMRTEFLSMYNLCHIRHTMDTRDDFYKSENDFFDRQIPNFQALVTRLYQVVLNSSFRETLEKSWGEQFYRTAELSLRTFVPAANALYERKRRRLARSDR